MKKTKYFNKEERNWVVIDAKGKILGRLASRIARILQGKNKAQYSPNFLCGDKVVVINAKHIRVTGTKMETKIYDKYSGYPSGRKEMPLNILIKKNPSKPLYLAVKGMLPKNWLGKQMRRGLKIYTEGEHRQVAQKPKKIEV
ncbi:MAG: 50S ribosomal protein L13 [Candidatus Omnitrophota bacterium]|nr:50S ribosomal protein L13 [Candidatus Omnitrophota bacterium]